MFAVHRDLPGHGPDARINQADTRIIQRAPGGQLATRLAASDRRRCPSGCMRDAHRRHDALGDAPRSSPSLPEATMASMGRSLPSPAGPSSPKPGQVSYAADRSAPHSIRVNPSPRIAAALTTPAAAHPDHLVGSHQADRQNRAGDSQDHEEGVRDRASAEWSALLVRGEERPPPPGRRQPSPVEPGQCSQPDGTTGGGSG